MQECIFVMCSRGTLWYIAQEEIASVNPYAG